MTAETRPQHPYQYSQPQPSTKAGFKAWWNHFIFAQRMKKNIARTPYPEADTVDHPVFGKPLSESLRYASVQISTANNSGELHVWGHVPVVVAKCGLHLKEHATDVEGIFRVNGSNRRMRHLQTQFEAPPRYGKSLDWKQESYTMHDVASVFRRYLTQMPEPVIPYDMYHDFRNVLLTYASEESIITQYKVLLRRLPRPNQYLLLYVLDLLSVFARRSDRNLMTATNLAVIFRPGIISHPQHELAPQEHALSQRVLEFLIAHQDWFLPDVPLPSSSAGVNASGGPVLRRVSEGFREGHMREGERDGDRGGGKDKQTWPGTENGAGRSAKGEISPSIPAPGAPLMQEFSASSSQPPGLGSPPHSPKTAPTQSRNPGFSPSRDPGASAGSTNPVVGFATSRGSSDIDDVMIVPSSDDEYSGVGGGWDWVAAKSDIQGEMGMTEQDRQWIRTARRRTAVEGNIYGSRNEEAIRSTHDTYAAGDGDGGAQGIVRSRTLPSTRRHGQDAAGTSEVPRRVLRKQRRTLSSAGRTSHGHGQGLNA